jgi:AcrR family transcriptional regulator
MPSLSADSPLRASRDNRRVSLSLHFATAIEDLLREDSYANLPVERIVAAGGISRASFYRYFDDKNDLLLEMLNHVVADLLAAGDQWWSLPVSASKADLEAAHRRIAGVYRQHRLLMKAVVETASNHPDVRETYDALVTRSVENVTHHIELGQQDGFIAPHLPARRTAELFVYMGEQSLYRIIGLGGETDDTHYPDPLAEIYWRTLYEGYRDPDGGRRAQRARRRNHA